MRIPCFRCGKSVSTEVPEETVVRAVCTCPECIEKQPTIADLEFKAYPKEPAPAVILVRLPEDVDREGLEQIAKQISDTVAPVWPDCVVLMMSDGFDLETVDPETLRQLMERTP